MSTRAAVLLVGNAQLSGGMLWLGLLLIVWGAMFGGGPLAMLYNNTYSMREHAGMLFSFVGLGQLGFFTGVYLVLRRRHVRFVPVRKVVESVQSFLGGETTERVPLVAFECLSLEPQTSSKGNLSYALTLRGAKAKDIPLGDSFSERADAVAAGMRAAAVNVLPLDERNEAGIVLRLRAEQLAELSTEQARGRAQLAPWWRDISVLALLVANLVPLAGVLFWEWQVLPLMLLFWLENLIIGVYTIARMWLVPGGAGIGLSLFFAFHYGMFCFVHGMIIFAVFGPRAGGLHPDTLMGVISAALFRHGLIWAALALVVSHGIYFVRGYLQSRAFETADAGKLMMSPYKRIVVLHVVILIGGFLAQGVGAPVLALALLIALKIMVDLGAHLTLDRAPLLEEYRELAQAQGEVVVPVVAPPPSAPAPAAAAPSRSARPASHYIGGWRPAPNEIAPPGWFAAIEFRGNGRKLRVQPTHQARGANAETLAGATVHGDAAHIDWIEVRLHGGGRRRILRFTASATEAGRLDLSEVQYPENNRTATQMKSFSLVRA